MGKLKLKKSLYELKIMFYGNRKKLEESKFTISKLQRELKLQSEFAGKLNRRIEWVINIATNHQEKIDNKVLLNDIINILNGDVE